MSVQITVLFARLVISVEEASFCTQGSAKKNAVPNYCSAEFPQSETADPAGGLRQVEAYLFPPEVMILLTGLEQPFDGRQLHGDNNYGCPRRVQLAANGSQETVIHQLIIAIIKKLRPCNVRQSLPSTSSMKYA